MEQQKTLVDLITDQVESTRVLTVADLLFQIETYTRNVSLMIGGLIVKNAGMEAARDLFGIQQSLDEMGLWLKGHYGPLYDRLQPVAVQAHEVPTAPTDEQTIH